MHVGDLVRQYRVARGMSLDDLAKATNYSKSLLGMIERDERTLCAAAARACDDALGTSGMLSAMIDRGDGVNRRAMLMAASLGGVAGSGLLARLVQTGIWDRAGMSTDYDALVDRYARGFVSNAGDGYVNSLLAEIVVLEQRIGELSQATEELRAAARLSELYGLCLGNALDFVGAMDWYRIAIMYATRSGDVVLRDYISARTSNRAAFEGASLRTVEDGLAVALAGSRPTPGRVEGLAARVCIDAVRGNATGARHALAQMTDTVDRLPDGHGISHLRERAAFHRAYMAAHIGTLDEAYAAVSDAQASLSRAGLTYWQQENGLYWALAQVRAGGAYIRTGIEHALTVLNDGTPLIGVTRLAAREVYESIDRPRMYADLMSELRPYVSPQHGPWKTLVGVA